MLKLFFYTLLVFLQSHIIQDIDKQEVSNLLNNEVVVIDVRTNKEFKEGNIETSFNLDFQKREFIDSLDKLDKNKEYLIYCASGNRSLKASHIMKSLGFKIIYNYKKGYKDWIKD
ncbi:MAG: rhodanese-like domain-containing protein [Cryomorphaceae bacterium]|jgi:rhodanese-related sulfurtransferase|nr:rhodanese-like domain-containing protein [Cryomorphaceae bacterium]MBT3689660.1 rhodanese-like domain-containing protein [Cryomorphaceae bacterium]MBT4221781.1 rhodanese-like domain-containing protein [Cryomorphaceae bacterium]MBT4517524.1 rhodanese-like domain-containing protein [Cryomorphaceae bacterium]MBT5936420.1 rhodanese-like domain-containing protein [Cryomorphaceae bacterium]